MKKPIWDQTRPDTLRGVSLTYAVLDEVADIKPEAWEQALPEFSRQYESSEEKMSAKTPAWQRKAGQNPKGGLNAKGRASYNAATGGNLKAPVKSGDNPRRASFLARMGNMPGPEIKDGEPTRLLLSLRAWGASSKADAKAKARAISARNKAKSK